MKKDLKSILCVVLAAILSLGAFGAAFAMPAEDMAGKAASSKAVRATATDATPTDVLAVARREDGFAYVLSGGQAVIVASDASVKGDVTVPELLGGAPVGTIGVGAFRGRAGITSVALPDSVTQIDEWAFAGCAGLRSVTFGVGQRVFPENAFEDCVSLTQMRFAEGSEDFLTSSDGVVFTADQTELIYVPQNLSGDYVVPAAVKKIRAGAFAGCTLLRSVTMPARLSSIGEGAFLGCTALETVDFTGAAQIGADAFTGTPFAAAAGAGEFYLGDNLIRAALPLATPTEATPTEASPTDAEAPSPTDAAKASPTDAEQAVYTVRPGTVSVACGAFAPLPRLEEIILPNSVKVLTDGAFAGLPLLKKVNIPASVVYGGSAFDHDPGSCAHEKTVVRYAETEVCTQPHFAGCTYCADCAELLRVGEVLPAAGHRFRYLRQEADLDLGEVVVLTECAVCGETRRVPLSEYNKPFETVPGAYADGDFIVVSQGVTAADLLAGCPAESLVLTLKGETAAPDGAAGSGMTVLFPTSRQYTVILFGDADGDGDVTPADARLALRISVRLEPPLVWRDKASHVILDGQQEVTSADARLILRATANLEDTAILGKIPTATPTDATPSDATPTDATPTDAKPAKPQPEDLTGAYVCRWTGGVYLRKSHSYDADPLKVVPNGETVTVTEVYTDDSGTEPIVWGRITFDGVAGWTVLKYYEAVKTAGPEE